MNNGDACIVFLGVNEDGEHIAATNTSPYFCFTGASEAEVIAKSDRALRFLETITLKRPTASGKTATLSRLQWRRAQPAAA